MIIDRCSSYNFLIADLLLMEKALVERYNRFYLNGYHKRAIRHLLIILLIRKAVKGQKGYETHDFS